MTAALDVNATAVVADAADVIAVVVVVVVVVTVVVVIVVEVDIELLGKDGVGGGVTQHRLGQLEEDNGPAGVLEN
jgi:hypothetical protein